MSTVIGLHVTSINCIEPIRPRNEYNNELRDKIMLNIYWSQIGNWYKIIILEIGYVLLARQNK